MDDPLVSEKRHCTVDTFEAIVDKVRQVACDNAENDAVESELLARHLEAVEDVQESRWAECRALQAGVLNALVEEMQDLLLQLAHANDQIAEGGRRKSQGNLLRAEVDAVEHRIVSLQLSETRLRQECIAHSEETEEMQTQIADLAHRKCILHEKLRLAQHWLVSRVVVRGTVGNALCGLTSQMQASLEVSQREAAKAAKVSNLQEELDKSRLEVVSKASELQMYIQESRAEEAKEPALRLQLEETQDEAKVLRQALIDVQRQDGVAQGEVNGLRSLLDKAKKNVDRRPK